jgi:hypothetical protein
MVPLVPAIAFDMHRKGHTVAVVVIEGVMLGKSAARGSRPETAI